MAVIAGFDNPLAVFSTDDLSDVVRPHDHGADPGWPRPAPVRPIAREIVARAGILADQTPHLPAAPRRGPRPVAAAVCGYGPLDRHVRGGKAIQSIWQRRTGSGLSNCATACGHVMVMMTMIAVVMLPRGSGLSENHHSRGSDR